MKKKNLFYWYVLTTMMLYDFVAFADPEDDNDGGDLEDGDDRAVPINGKLIWLAIAGVFFVYYIYRSYNNREKQA